MEDFEYSVEISDRDWECFFVECEECNQLPPSLAGVDDSGMSDIDDTGFILAKKVQRVDPIAGFSETDRPIDGPPDCEGSPAEHYLSKHGVGGLESVLSGSEEDIHLQSVNVFFERLKDVREAEGLSEPGKDRDGKNREVTQEEEWCSDGQKASSRTLPKNIPKLNSLPARGETAVGKETTEPVDTISNINTKRKDEPGSNISTEPAASNSVLKTNKSAHPETKLYITEEACTETRVNEATQQNQSHDSRDKVLSSETTSPTGKVVKVETCTPLDDIKQEYVSTRQLTVIEKRSTDSQSYLEKVTNVKWEEDQYLDIIQPDAISTNKTASQESSPSASVRRRRRKKRRLSVEPAEGVHGYEKQASVKQSDSEEERHTGRGGTCQPEDVNILYSNEPQKNLMSSLNTYSTTINLPVTTSTKETKVNDLSHYRWPCDSQHQYSPDSIVGQGRCEATRTAENNAITDGSVTALSQTGDSAMSAPNNTTNLQPCSTLQVEESTGLNKYPGLPAITNGITGRSDLAIVTLPDKINYCVVSCEMNNEQNPESYTAEVKSITQSILPSAVSSDPAMEVSQNGKLSATKSVLAAQAGNTGRDNYTVCQKEAEPQQQLEIDCHYTDQNNCTLGKTPFPLSATGTSSSDAHITNPKQLKTGASLFLEEICHQVDSAKFTSDTSNSVPDKACPSSSSSLDKNITAQQTEHHLIPTLSKFNGLPEENTAAERAELTPSHMMAFCSGSPCLSSEMNQTGKSRRETISSMSELTSLSDITSVSSCCTLDTESVTSLSNENITDMSGHSPSSVSQNEARGQGEKTSLTLATRVERDGTSRPKSQFGSDYTADSKCDVVVKAEDAVTSKTEYQLEKAPDSKPSVFAMSSFWSEMEKLTINDILGLRMIDRAAPTSSLPSLPECEEMDMFSINDSRFSTQLDAKSEQTNKDMSSSSNSGESSSGCVTAVDSSTSRGVMWESNAVPMRLGAHIYPENMKLTSFSKISQPVLPGRPQTCPRKISKNVSVRNLHALESESFSYTWKGQALQTLDKAAIEKGEHLPDGHVHKQAKDMGHLASSSTDSYRISLTDIFQYLFGGKQSMSSQPATDNITSYNIDGNSVPETYDHFFSEFDTESFFYPLITQEDQDKDTLVPIFSYSRSANRNLQFPEAYDHFFPSSSSDDESDDEDTCGPVRVVSRFNPSSSTSPMFTDIYENFFTDCDLRQNFFWRTTFSFRNINFTGSKAQKQTEALPNPQSRVPGSQSRRSLRRTISSINALGNQEVVFSDPFLFNLEDRISRQLAQQPFRYEDLQMAISNPRLDASLVPLRQSDMCLLCIAFASWVLKTANPQVGDAWKAVLLANVSALSAIRYLRKYVKMEANVDEKKLLYSAPSGS